jgi:hypothetical protein
MRMETNMSTTHTAGPWAAETNAAGLKVKSAEGDIIATPSGFDVGQEKAEANARLIAAAPEMLAALHRADAALSLLMATGNGDRHDLSALESIRAAIAKATGGAL